MLRKISVRMKKVNESGNIGLPSITDARVIQMSTGYVSE